MEGNAIDRNAVYSCLVGIDQDIQNALAKASETSNKVDDLAHVIKASSSPNIKGGIRETYITLLDTLKEFNDGLAQTMPTVIDMVVVSANSAGSLVGETINFESGITSAKILTADELYYSNTYLGVTHFGDAATKVEALYKTIGEMNFCLENVIGHFQAMWGDFYKTAPLFADSCHAAANSIRAVLEKLRQGIEKAKNGLLEYIENSKIKTEESAAQVQEGINKIKELSGKLNITIPIAEP